MSTRDSSAPDEEAVLMAFSVEPNHDRETLERYIKEFPEHAAALIDCSIDLMVQGWTGDVTAAATSDGAVEKAWQRFQLAIEEPVAADALNPFAKLDARGFKAAARSLDVSSLFLIRLRDRAIDAATIPPRLIEKLASELAATAQAVSEYLRSPPSIVSGHSFRSDVKPTVAEQITFEQAIETSQLTPAQKAALNALSD